MGASVSSSDLNRDCQNVTTSKSSQYSGLKDFQNAYSPIHGYFGLILCIFGVVANLANIIVLTRKNLRSSVNLILTWLAAADLATMLVYLFQLLHFNIFSASVLPNMPHTYSRGWITYSLIVISLALVLHTSACWLTVALAIFRYIYIALPTRGSQIASHKNSSITIFAIFFILSLTNIPNYLVNAPRACRFQNKTVVYFIALPEGVDYNVANSNYWTIAILYKIIPCIILLAMTVLLIIEMSKASKRRKKLLSSGKSTKKDQKKDSREQRTTAMLLCIVILFFITEMPQGIMSLLCFLIENFADNIYSPLGDVLDLLSLINNGVNFVLYTTMSKQFRDTFYDVFLFWCPKCKSESPQNNQEQNHQQEVPLEPQHKSDANNEINNDKNNVEQIV